MQQTMTRPPVELASGETTTWRVERSEFPASEGWSMTTHLRGLVDVDLVGLVDDDGFVFEIETTTFTAANAGGYVWETVATSGAGDEVCRVAQGRLVLVAGLAVSSDLGTQTTHAERMLAALEAALEGTATKSQRSYTIAGRSIERIPLLELEGLHARYKRRVDRERMLSARGIDRAPRKVRAILP